MSACCSKRLVAAKILQQELLELCCRSSLRNKDDHTHVTRCVCGHLTGFFFLFVFVLTELCSVLCCVSDQSGQNIKVSVGGKMKNPTIKLCKSTANMAGEVPCLHRATLVTCVT